MKTILVVNAGSSSLKFQVFALGTLPDRNAWSKVRSAASVRGRGCAPRQPTRNP
jgi:acetate kinase